MLGLFLSIEINWQTTIFAIVGGLGIFLFGMNMMSESLKKLAGSKLKMILEKSTNTPLKGIFVGILITALIQSSSATSALVVGLARAGLMTLPQAVGVIFGANIGTTFTSLIISLNIGKYAMVIIFLGSILIFFFRRKKVQEAGRVIMGFGMLFFGLETMGTQLKQLVLLPGFSNLLLSVADHPILGVFVGVGTTVVVQSSSATIGILQQLYTTGGVPLIGAIAIVLGDNIGTTITSIMASIGGTSTAKRTATIHVMFNTIGTVVFFILLRPYSSLIGWMAEKIVGADYLTNRFTISLAHVTFNILTVFVLYFFVKQMVWLVTKIIPSKGEFELTGIVLDKTLLKESPDLAMENAKLGILHMGEICKTMFEYMYSYSFENDSKLLEKGGQCEEMLDTMDAEIHNYLVKISANDLGKAQVQLLAKYIDTLSDFERMGDHMDNLFEFFQERHDNKMIFHEEAIKELTDIYQEIRKSLSDAVTVFDKRDLLIANHIHIREDIIDYKVKKYRKNHINRISDQGCPDFVSGFYADILSNLERMGDHCNNIAINVLVDTFTHEDPFVQKIS